jgi:hypothetical protein
MKRKHDNDSITLRTHDSERRTKQISFRVSRSLKQSLDKMVKDGHFPNATRADVLRLCMMHGMESMGLERPADQDPIGFERGDDDRT